MRQVMEGGGGVKKAFDFLIIAYPFYIAPVVFHFIHFFVLFHFISAFARIQLLWVMPDKYTTKISFISPE